MITRDNIKTLDDAKSAIEKTIAKMRRTRARLEQIQSEYRRRVRASGVVFIDEREER